MASHGVSWVSGAHVRFGDLDFVVTMEGDLAQAPTAIQPLHSNGLDAIAEVLEELQLHAPEAHAPGETISSASITGSYYAYSAPSWDPDRPGRTCATSPSHSPML